MAPARAGESSRTQNLLQLHDGTICPHPLMDRMLFAGMTSLEDLGILVVIIVLSHIEALCCARSP